ncbi:hypothetical protein K456DRAFT_46069 [Colletotrichum gloeosporioides 23]|uniref:Uncharacterized protein n=1 Tax=Colletotrichum asianum TaxID=702518 RepID=A0A8H3VZA9_9PEZI|nr:hypothetical protein GQ607_015093 [Colletotrichum asianum]KAH9240978.1 hypothetical protein K456DRAFT_46069 [Colletotrichum gloeosporioides 23]
MAWTIPFRNTSKKSPGPQSIAVGHVNPAKLAEKLRTTFIANSFDVELVHNTYSIRASRHLTTAEIEACK